MEGMWEPESWGCGSDGELLDRVVQKGLTMEVSLRALGDEHSMMGVQRAVVLHR